MDANFKHEFKSKNKIKSNAASRRGRCPRGVEYLRCHAARHVGPLPWSQHRRRSLASGQHEPTSGGRDGSGGEAAAPAPFATWAGGVTRSTLARRGEEDEGPHRLLRLLYGVSDGRGIETVA
jgi:hypothetical protein